MTEHPLTCVECGAKAPPDAVRYRAYVVGVDDEVDAHEEVVTYCAEREFD